MDECDVPVEEVGECWQSGDEAPTLADADWKDELNLAEFPIAALSDRIPDGQTAPVFEDRLERRDSQPIVRRLTIMGTHKHGSANLPRRRGPGGIDPAHMSPEEQRPSELW